MMIRSDITASFIEQVGNCADPLRTLYELYNSNKLESSTFTFLLSRILKQVQSGEIRSINSYVEWYLDRGIEMMIDFIIEHTRNAYLEVYGSLFMLCFSEERLYQLLDEIHSSCFRLNELYYILSLVNIPCDNSR